jgi:hypothetical protein
VKELLLFRKTAGLNARLDPVRLRYDPETGVVDLSQSRNIVVDDTGRPGRRPGRNLISAGVYHSTFCGGGDCFAVQDRESDAAIMKVNSDYTLTGVRSSLTKAAKMSWCQVNDETYYTNGTQNGYIKDGVSAAWPVQTYVGAETRRDLTAPPKGKHLGFHRGRMIITEGPVAWFTEYFQFGLLDRSRYFVQTMSDIRMVAPVKAGVFISDENRTYFFTGSNPIDFTEDIVATYPAHEYSLAHDPIEVVDIELEMRGLARLWSSTQGTCLGLPDGTLLNLTKKKIIYPDVKTSGASLIWDGSFGMQGIVNTY